MSEQGDDKERLMKECENLSYLLERSEQKRSDYFDLLLAIGFSEPKLLVEPKKQLHKAQYIRQCYIQLPQLAKDAKAILNILIEQRDGAVEEIVKLEMKLEEFLAKHENYEENIDAV